MQAIPGSHHHAQVPFWDSAAASNPPAAGPATPPAVFTQSRISPHPRVANVLAVYCQARSFARFRDAIMKATA